jgi:hypothetical protein
MIRFSPPRIPLAAILAAAWTTAAPAQDTGSLDQGKADKVHAAKPPYSPYANRDFPTRPFFGDTHLPTSFSMDAAGYGDFVAADARERLPAQVGYTKGVPMGGDLRGAPAGKSPTFLVAALKDPIGANLDRYQIVKGTRRGIEPRPGT